MSDQPRGQDWMPSGGRASKRLTDAEAAMLAEQLSGVARAGLPLPGGLRAMAEELPGGRLHAVLINLAAWLEQGVPLDRALEQMGPQLPGHLRGLVLAGMRSGRLGEVLAQYVRYHSLAHQLRRNTASSLAYPAALGIVFLGVFSFMIVGVVPKFKKIFMDFGINLPHVTLSLVALSDWVIHFGPALLMFLAIGLPVGFVLARVMLGPPQWQRLMYRTPLVGSMWRWTGLAQFARLLAMLVESELPLPTALRLAGGGVQDAEVADAASQMACEVEAGCSLAASETRRHRFPGGLAQSLQWGESAHSLAESLCTAAEMLEGKATLHAEFLFRVAPPLTMILLVFLLGFVVMALFLPIIGIINALSG
jgi:general secretion pathway protein F